MTALSDFTVRLRIYIHGLAIEVCLSVCPSNACNCFYIVEYTRNFRKRHYTKSSFVLRIALAFYTIVSTERFYLLHQQWSYRASERLWRSTTW